MQIRMIIRGFRNVQCETSNKTTQNCGTQYSRDVITTLYRLIKCKVHSLLKYLGHNNKLIISVLRFLKFFLNLPIHIKAKHPQI